VARLKIKDIDRVFTPPDRAFTPKDGAGGLNPDLLSEGLWNHGLAIATRLRVAHRYIYVTIA